jgi:hypothetical protein
MLNKNTKIRVRNRNNGVVVYTLPDMNNLRRKFYPNETKELTFEELQKLSYRPGGPYLLENYLVIENEEARAALVGEVELEYSYTEEDVKNLLLNGSLDELLDCLDFAPAGVISLVKDLAVKLEINDLSKREAIQQQTGLNVTKAIEIKHAIDTTDAEIVGPVGRRAAMPSENPAAAAPVRRTVTKK